MRLQRMLSFALAMLMLFGIFTGTPEKVAAAQSPFVDVTENNQFFDSVMWAVERNITVGTGDGTTFDPNGQVTRGQFVMFLWRLAGKPEPEQAVNPFTDFNQNSAFYKPIMWAYQQGIVAGKTKTTFGLKEPCTRGHVVLFLYRYAGKPAYETDKEGFPDVTVNNKTYGKAVMWAVANNITSGMKDGKFGLDVTCNRSQAVMFLYRYERSRNHLDHAWEAATCETPKTCSICALTEGNALGHSWVEATTEAPKTCSVCHRTEGDRIITDERFTTEACAPLFGSWSCRVETTAKDLEIADTEEAIVYIITMDFAKDGALTQTVAFEDPDAVVSIAVEAFAEEMYAEFEKDGWTREQVDALMKAEYNQTLREYVQAQLVESNFAAPQTGEYVYYVQENRLYTAENWTAQMAYVDFTVTENTLTLIYEGGVSDTYTRLP